MGKKKRRKEEKQAIRNHELHHQQVHEFMVRSSGVDLHSMPMAQPWHAPSTSCFCSPIRDEENPLTGQTLWIHRALVH